MNKISHLSEWSGALWKMRFPTDGFNKTRDALFSTTVWMDSSCLDNGSGGAVQARWVWDWSPDPCYLVEFSQSIIELLLISLLICSMIILYMWMYLPGMLLLALILAVSEPD